MPIMEVYIDANTADRLTYAARDLGRTPEELAEAAIAEAALNDAKARYANGERSPMLNLGVRS